ncbi:MAG: hypothetical protein GY953_38655, partial [bacterium]|nr:hypothetical protein [bacterium]
YQELTGSDGYRHGESKLRFLARHGASNGPVDTDRLPYYLLLVGKPDAIPFELQYQLDVQYAIGRVGFDQNESYRHYARAVVAAENGTYGSRREVDLFSVHHEKDPTLQNMQQNLMAPLGERLLKETRDWSIRSHDGPVASKQRLRRLLGGDMTPALLFASCHGIGFPSGDPVQRRRQGALLCADAHDPGSIGTPYFCASDLAPDACLGGLIAFVFACFGA